MDKIIIVSAFINTAEKTKLLTEALLQFRKTPYKILLVGNSVFPPEILKLTDYCIYTDENILLEKDKSPINWYADAVETIHIYSKGTGYSIIRNANLALNFAHNLGFKYFFFFDYDNVIADNDLELLTSTFLDFEMGWTDAFVCRFNHYGEAYESRIFAGNIQFFIENIPLPNTYEKWNTTFPYATSSHTLEYIFPVLFKNFTDRILFFDGYNRDFFKNSKIDVCSSVPDIHIVFNNEDVMRPLIFLIGDDKQYDITIDGIPHSSMYLKKGELHKQYLLLLDKDVKVEIRSDHRIITHLLNLENIFSYKDKATRFKL